jgi:hypothetical protein
MCLAYQYDPRTSRYNPSSNATNNTFIYSGQFKPEEEGSIVCQNATAINNVVVHYGFWQTVEDSISIGPASAFTTGNISVKSGPVNRAGGLGAKGALYFTTPAHREYPINSAFQVGTCYENVSGDNLDRTECGFTFGNTQKMVWAAMAKGCWAFEFVEQSYPEMSKYDAGEKGSVLLSKGDQASPHWQPTLSSYTFTSKDGKKVTITNGHVTAIEQS